MNKENAFWLILAIAVILVGIWTLGFRGSGAGKLDAFAQCLAEKEITMYGADWCGHCQNEKRAFGSSFRFVPYVECPKETAVCLEKKITGYPTWIMKDGTRLEGEQGIEKLSEVTGCVVPK